MRSIRIDRYHYCNPNDKKDWYNKETYSEEEMNKTRSLRQRIFEYKKIVGKERYVELPTDEIHEYVTDDIETNIRYNENVGYISTCNGMDDDIVDIYYYGNDEEEAFINVIVDYEFDVNHSYELENRESLMNDYSNRYPDKEYKVSFYVVELSLQDLRKYYRNNIHTDIIKYYEEYLSVRLCEDFKYDYDSDKMIKDNKVLIKD